jgi:hypothetical protein
MVVRSATELKGARPLGASERQTDASRPPLDAGAAKQISDFKSDLILNFAYSRDGRQVAFALGSQSRDAVLINEVK